MKTYLLLLSLAACAPRTPPAATAGDASRANVELAQLQQGRQLLISKCGSSCHTTPMPRDHSVLEWPGKLDEMSERANLDPRQRALIEKYLVTMAQR
jgi:hypothetical protein